MKLARPDLRTVATLEKAIFRAERIRVVFRHPPSTQLLCRATELFLVDNITIASLMKDIKDMMRVVGADGKISSVIHMSIVSKGGMVPVGQTLVKNVRFN